MSRMWKLVLLLAGLMVAAAIAAELTNLAAPAGPTEVVAPTQAAAVAEGERESAAPAGVSPQSAMMQEVNGVMSGEQAALAELADRAAQAANETEALAVQEEVENVKRGTELLLLDVQAKHARQAGEEDRAVQIEQDIDLINNPPAPPPAEPRPAPVEGVDY